MKSWVSVGLVVVGWGVMSVGFWMVLPAVGVLSAGVGMVVMGAVMDIGLDV